MSDTAMAKRIVLVSIAWMAAVALYDSKAKNAGSTFKRMWGVGVIGLALSVLADIAPQIAGPFAGLTALGVTFSPNGEQALLNLLGGAKTSRAPASASSTAHHSTATRTGSTSPGAR